MLAFAKLWTDQVACRTTRRAAEKRQRVLLSSKYDEAVLETGRQIGDIKEMLQTFMSTKDTAPRSPGISDHAQHTPRSMIDEQVPSLSSVHEGYNGDPSFQSHARRVENTLEATFSISQLIHVQPPGATLQVPPQETNEPLRNVGTANISASGRTASPGFAAQSFELEPADMPLPPLDIVLKLLRLAKIEKQRFFVDIPTFQEDEFVDMCRAVYFATEPVSLWTWIDVNIGLYYLFLGVNEACCIRMDTTTEAMCSHGKVLKTNAEAAMQSLRLCSEPSVESCRALSLLKGVFYIKEGHNTIAWRLISAAARACLDLGFHRLLSHRNSQEDAQKRRVFWHIYSWEKGLAMTCGRTPVIHHYDVSTVYPAAPEGFRKDPINSVLSKLYKAFLDFAVVTGEIQRKLFSASTQHASQQEVEKHVGELAARLLGLHETVASAKSDDPTWDEMYQAIAILLDIEIYSLLTSVYRMLPPTSMSPHPLQCSDECVDTARVALTKLVNAGEKMLESCPAGWGNMLNLILSMAPFVSYLVLAGNAIATSSGTDLPLLSSAVSVLAPSAASSHMIRKMHDACERFGRIVPLIVSSVSGGSSSQNGLQTQAPHGGFPLDQMTVGPDTSNDMPMNSLDYGFPMAQEDWDNVMMGFESELGNYDPRALTDIMEPYIANAGW
ncbi:Uu.00g024700.m01.CDS01 [Anthostomella pinea]|uniref:Uu.00g024700.m01.CDS01 n=1 Tax=Anthostomella pinea TaxID=933095 RepID=A0AAI8V7S2_9PEZI|nr:Uu.00g024700.m01.CDS01 [Anthostomella pinea]